MKRILLLLTLLLLIWLGPLKHVAQANEPVMRAVLFWSETCPHCHIVLTETLPPLQEQYGRQLEVLTIDLSDPAHYELWLAAKEAFQVPPERRVPMLFIGDSVLVGSREIPERLPGLIEQYLAAGGVDYPAIPGLVAGPALTPTPPTSPTPTIKACHICDEEMVLADAPTPKPTVVSQDTGTPAAAPSTPAAGAPASPIHLAYFYQPGCRECDRVQLDLNYLQHRYPQLVAHTSDVEAETPLAEWLGQRAGLPEEKRLTAPAVFVGDEGLADEHLYTCSLEALIARHAASGAEPVWKGQEASQTEAAVSIVERFRSFVLPLVVVFLLAYFGTSSQQLGLLIQRRAATIKLATAGLCVLLAGWLVMTLL